MERTGATSSANDAQPQDHDRLPTQRYDGAMYNKPAVADAEEEEIEPEITIGQKMLSAVSGSVLTSLLVTPLDVVRVRLQSQQPATTAPTPRPNPTFPYPRSFANLPPELGVTSCCKEVFWVNNNAPYCVADASLAASPATGPASSSLNNLAAAESCAVAEVEKRTINSTVDGFRKIARNEGITTLWRGLSPTLMMAVPGNVIYFAGYDWLRTSPNSPIRPFNPDSSFHVPHKYAPLVAGSSARIMAALVVSPVELFRTRLQAAHSSSASSNFRETFNGIKEMVASQGPRSLWRGLTLTLWRDVPFSALYWWGYEVTKKGLGDVRSSRERGRSWRDTLLTTEALDTTPRSASHERARNHTATLIDSFIAGAVSGGLASFVTTPFDVGKTRRQVFRDSGDPKAAAAAAEQAAAAGVIRPEDRSMPRFLWHIFKEEGVRGLFKGWVPRLAKVAPACAIMISSYELGKKMAGEVKVET